MFCENCGTQVPDGASKCENCGHDMTASNEAKPVAKAPVNVAKLNTNANVKLDKNKIVGIAAAVVVLLIIVIFATTRKTTVNLNDYISVEFSGYDTVGRASVVFDRDKFMDDYEDKIEINEKAVEKAKSNDILQLYSMLTGDDYCGLFLDSCVSGSLDANNGLSNGDKVVYEWDCNEDDALEYFNVKLKFKDKEFEVEGLEKAKTVNPFDSIEVVFTGISPQGYANVEKTDNNDIMGSVYFEVSPSDGLKNGDTVTVKVNSAGDDDYYIEQYGAILSETEKTYTVEGLDCYAQSASEIPEDMLAKMKKQAEDHFTSTTVRWDETVSVSSVTYVGNYFLKPKFVESSDDNSLYLLYKIDVQFKNDEHSEKFAYYYYVKFEDLMILADGTCSVDLSRYEAARSSFEHDFKWGEDYDEHRRLYFDGYEDLDTMFNQLVTSRISDYEYENNVVE